MFPSPNLDNPFESLLKLRSPSSSSSLIQYPNNPSLLFNFPSPFLDEHESPLNQIFFQNPTADHDHNPTKRVLLNPGNGNGNSKMEELVRQNPSPAVAPPLRRRKAGKKDRHSKICTAQGIRDRRMRLSLQVARKFFDLQDMLGYDKASKTIEWLFTQSKKAIKELVDDYQTSPPPNSDVKSESFISECEDRMSGIEEINSNVVTPGDPAEMLKTSTIRPNARESREKARARARSRTREKMMGKRIQLSNNCSKPNPNPHHILPFEGVNHEDEIRVSSCSGLGQQQLSDVGMIEKFLGNSSSSTSCPMTEYGGGAAVSDYGDPSSGGLMGFMGNWDVLSNERSNCFQYSVTNQITFAGNFNSVYSATTQFP